MARNERGNGSSRGSSEESHHLEEFVALYLGRLNDGEALDPPQIMADHPELGAEILRDLEAFVNMTGDVATDQPLGTLGDYTLRRQIGRGGMGVVYEAWENSMDRAVALKVLPAGIAADDRAFQRFLQEAKTAGKLSHPNVVPVYFTGVKDETPFYAMELIDGETLARILARWRDAEPAAQTPFGAKDEVAYYGNLAKAFADIADGLQHAHSKGVTHRDIKPSNLILDRDGRLRILDFGLARLEGQESLTLSGDFVGTPLYMSPEQARRKKIPVDHRSDVWSMGATMYEALCGRPPFCGKDHADTLSQIVEREPVEPRKRNPSVPRDLETIVLCCLRKDADDRYQTAEALAQDLRRFVRGDPVEARPPSGWHRLASFTRRHRVVLGFASLVALFVVLAGGVVGWMALDHAARRAVLEQQISSALADAKSSYQSDRLHEAMGAVQRAEGLVAGGDAKVEFAHEVRRWRIDLEMIELLENVRLEKSAVKDDHFDWPSAEIGYREAFRSYGLDVTALDAEEAAARIRASAIRDALVTALDDWIVSGKGEREPHDDRLRALVERADSDPWRRRLRETIQEEDEEALEKLARSPDALAQPPSTLQFLARSLGASGRLDLAVEVLEGAQRRHPGDLWINHDLAYHLMRLDPSRSAEAIGFYRAAVALRQESPGLHLALGNALEEHGRLDRAAAEYREALRLEPGYGRAQFSLGDLSREKDRLDDAVAEWKKALAMKPEDAGYHLALISRLLNIQRWDEALVACDDAIDLDAAMASAHAYRAEALIEKGRPEEAIAAAQRATEFDEDLADARRNFARALFAKGRPDDGLAALEEAVERNPDDARSASILGYFLAKKGRREEGLKLCERAARLRPALPEVHANLGVVYRLCGKLEKALESGMEAIRREPKRPQSAVYDNLGNTYQALSRRSEAIEAYEKAIELRPDNAWAYYNLGVLHHGDNLDAAMDHYKACLARDPNHAWAHGNLGAALLTKGRPEEAVGHLESAARLEPRKASAHYSLANAYRANGQLEKAIAAWERAVELQPTFIKAWCRLGAARSEAGRPKDAARAFAEALRLDPDHAAVHLRQGLDCYDKGELDGAIAAWRRAVYLEPERAGLKEAVVALREAGESGEAELGRVRAAVVELLGGRQGSPSAAEKGRTR